MALWHNEESGNGTLDSSSKLAINIYPISSEQCREVTPKLRVGQKDLTQGNALIYMSGQSFFSSRKIT